MMGSEGGPWRSRTGHPAAIAIKMSLRRRRPREKNITGFAHFEAGISIV